MKASVIKIDFQLDVLFILGCSLQFAPLALVCLLVALVIATKFAHRIIATLALSIGPFHCPMRRLVCQLEHLELLGWPLMMPAVVAEIVALSCVDRLVDEDQHEDRLEMVPQLVLGVLDWAVE